MRAASRAALRRTGATRRPAGSRGAWFMHHRYRSRRWTAGGTAALLTVTISAATMPAAATAAAPRSAVADQRVIVLLRDQLAGTPTDPAHLAARRRLADASQRAVL